MHLLSQKSPLNCARFASRRRPNLPISRSEQGTRKMEQHFQEDVANHENGSAQQKSGISALDNPAGCFDCNICLDNAQDPVVTLCGHLYCWSCIYKWLYFQGASITQEEKQQCPVCKASISQTTVVPLYGRGESSQNEIKVKGSLQGMDIPSRPRASTTSIQNFDPHPYGLQSPRRQQYTDGIGISSSITPTAALHPMIGMFGEMVFTRVFGNSHQGASVYWYPNSYHHMRSTSPRLRRQEMQAEKSLNRISIFLFCCFVLCVLLF